MQTANPRAPRLFVLAASILAGCHSYYPARGFTPDQVVHEVRRSGPDGAVIARVSAMVPGVRAPGDARPSLHARFEIENTGGDRVVFRTSETRATPSGVTSLAPSNDVASVDVPPSETRVVDVFFPLAEDLPDTALGEVVVAWVLVLGDREHRNTAKFERRSYYRRYYRYGYPYWRPYSWYPYCPPYYGRWYPLHHGRYRH